MLRSPFRFLRGSAGLMAYGLAAPPSTGLRVKACGDCHPSGFLERGSSRGSNAAPEYRRITTYLGCISSGTFCTKQLFKIF
jgi:hypothetical protein